MAGTQPQPVSSVQHPDLAAILARLRCPGQVLRFREHLLRRWMLQERG